MDWLKYYNRENQQINSMSSLVDLIAEVFEIEKTKLFKHDKHNRDLLREKNEFMAGKPATLTLEAIPEIAVSELGWTDVTGKGDSEVAGPARQRLLQFLKNIEGSNFVEKIANLSRFYEDPDAAMAEMFPVSSDAPSPEKIKVALSYMVFFKTLTKVISNFNAASAGFNFEAFLAVLADGYQVPANKGTIADFISRADGVEVPISLKLYGEGHLHVGGSFTDLVNDLAEPQYGPPMMRYIAVTKKFDDDKKAGLDINGTLKFMRFDFNLDNVMDIISVSSKQSRNNALLASEFIRRVKEKEQDIDYRSGLPGINLPPVEELEDEFLESLRISLAKVGLQKEEITMFEGIFDWAHNDKIFVPTQVTRYDEQGEKIVDSEVIRAMSEIPSSRSSAGNSREVFASIVDSVRANMPQRLQLAEDAPTKQRALFEKVVKDISNAPATANRALLAKYNLTQLKKERDAILANAFDGVTMEESLAVYNSLDEEQKKVALKNSLGYLTRKQFNLVQNVVENLDSLMPSRGQNAEGGNMTTKVLPDGQDSVVFGNIEIGAANTQKMLNRMTTVLNESLYDIFINVKAIQDNTYSYVAGGMQKDEQANAAISASAKVIRKTEELQGKGTNTQMGFDFPD